MLAGHARTYQSVERTLSRYCHLVDDGDYARLVELFTPDASFSYAGTTAVGHQQIREFFEATGRIPALRGKHLTANVVIDLDPDDPGIARVAADFVFLGWSKGRLVPRVAGRYDDTLAPSTSTEGEWLFTRRLARVLEPPAT